MKAYLSYSEIYLWQRDRAEYIRRYVKAEPQESNMAMELGKLIHGAIEEPRLEWVKQARDMQLTGKQVLATRKILTKMSGLTIPLHEFSMRTTQHEPELFGVFDGFDKERRILYEFKTTENPKAWSQYRVDTHLQLSMYAYMYQQVYHQYFSDIQLFVCDTKTGNVKKYHTARGPNDVWNAGQIIKKVYQEMKDASIWEQRVSSKDIAMRNQQALFDIKT